MHTRYLLMFMLCFIRSGWSAPVDPTLLYGLTFQAHTSEKEARTSLHLTPEKPLFIRNAFTLEFDIRLRQEQECFGFIFRLINESEGYSIDLVSDLLSDQLFSLIADEKTLLQINRTEISDFDGNQWLHIRLHMDDSRDRLTLDIGGLERETSYSLNIRGKYDLCFGGNSHPDYFTSDVPPMTIRDIRIDEAGKPLRHWPLDRHNGEITLDRIDGKEALASNPAWEMDSHVFWRKTAEFHLPGRYPQTAFDETEGRIFIAKSDLLYTFQTDRDSLIITKTNQGRPYNNMANCMAFLPQKRCLLSYCLENGTATRYDFETNRWENRDSAHTPLPQFWHHNRCVMPNGDLAVFGGYGFHRYQSQFRILPADSNGWRQATDLAATISPRYLSAMTATEDGRLLVFGGFGSLSGIQLEAPANRYDLYQIDLPRNKCEKIREITQTDDCYTCSNAMVYDSVRRICYALTYDNRKSSTWIKLREIPLDPAKPVRVLGDSIPYFFNDIESYCDLYMDRNHSRLFALTSHVNREGGERSEINLYTLAFPPISMQETTVPVKRKDGGLKWLWIGILAIGTFAAGRVVYRKRQSPETFPAPSPAPSPAPASNPAPESGETYRLEKKPRSIWLLGGFQVIDAEGNDITGNFTQTLKHIFLLILLETFKTGKGISSQRLNELLWYDKDEESARNNRNVNIRKLRLLLDKVGGVKISNDNSYWHLEINDREFFCDYISALSLLRELDTNENPDSEKQKRLFSLLSGGTLLSNTQFEWADGYKSEFSSLVIETLMEISHRPAISRDLKQMLRIADIILLHDSIDEDAVRLKCHALFHMGKKGSAKQAYDSFHTEYQRLLETPPPLSFDDLVRK